MELSSERSPNFGRRSRSGVSTRGFFPYNLQYRMPATLDQIIGATRARVARQKPSVDLRQLERAAETHVPRGFRQSLAARSQSSSAIIAELKKASPSRGVIRADFDPEMLAKELESAGATALSVLTNTEYFQGSLDSLRLASSVTRLPCLRKDFFVDEIQIIEARANGADAILLIVAALTQSELENLANRARAMGLDILCEVHDASELERAVDTGFNLIGVNNRDLRTFQVNLETAIRLADRIPAGILRVAESGIHNGSDISRLIGAGYHAFLIGESLMKAQSPGAALQTLIEESKPPVSVRSRH